MSDDKPLVEVSAQEFFELCRSLYPEQTARVFAELRAAKLEALVRSMVEYQIEGEIDGSDEGPGTASDE